MFEQQIQNKKQELIQNLQSLIQIPSVYSHSTDPLKPFGQGPSQALDFILSLGQSLGFRTKNIDGYCGYIECGEGDNLIGIIGHLDVVPEGDNWTYPPFSATIEDGKIYGRGAIDDKGPVMASLYAMKIILDEFQANCKSFSKRIRLILGLNEENDWKCINYYQKHEEIPTIGFSPDADFPCIYAEKGILSAVFKMNYQPDPLSPIKITKIDCQNNRLNVVPKICTTILTICPEKIDVNDFIAFVQKRISDMNYNITIDSLSETEIKLIAKGIGVHAAHPDLGINAISQLVIILDSVFKKWDTSIALFDYFTKTIGMDYTGTGLEISTKDESGNLTVNVGTFSLGNQQLQLGCNLRIPVHTPIKTIENQLIHTISSYPITCEFINQKAPLYLSKDNKLVTTLCDIYNQVTNSEQTPIAIGGATYARAFPNCISFGANLPGQKDMCHQTDEFISIDNLLLATQIYAQAIVKLLQL